MNQIEFLNSVIESRKRRTAALRQLRNTAKACGCDRCKDTVVAVRAMLKKGST